MACNTGESYSYVTMRCEPTASAYAGTTIQALGEYSNAPEKKSINKGYYIIGGSALLVLVTIIYLLTKKS